MCYWTHYAYNDGWPFILTFGFGKDATVIYIFGLPTIQEWGSNIDIRNNQLLVHYIGSIFTLFYKCAQSGLPEGFKFNSYEFERLQLITPTNNEFILTVATNDYTAVITNSCDYSTGILFRKIIAQLPRMYMIKVILSRSVKFSGLWQPSAHCNSISIRWYILFYSIIILTLCSTARSKFIILMFIIDAPSNIWRLKIKNIYILPLTMVQTFMVVSLTFRIMVTQYLSQNWIFPIIRYIISSVIIIRKIGRI